MLLIPNCHALAAAKLNSIRFLPGTKVFGKSINENPEKYYTDDIMEQLEAAAHKEFMYGVDEDEPEIIADGTIFPDEEEVTTQ